MGKLGNYWRQYKIDRNFPLSGHSLKASQRITAVDATGQGEIWHVMRTSGASIASVESEKLERLEVDGYISLED